MEVLQEEVVEHRSEVVADIPPKMLLLSLICPCFHGASAIFASCILLATNSLDCTSHVCLALGAAGVPVRYSQSVIVSISPFFLF